MPLISGSSDRKLVIITLTIFVLLTIVAAVFTMPEGEEGLTPPTTYSAASGGAKASYLLLKEMGAAVERWELSPEDLPKDGRATYILAGPQQFPTTEERAAIIDFVNNGGRLIAIGPIAAGVLPQQEAKPAVPESAWSKWRALAPSPFNRAQEITMRESAHWNAAEGHYVPLYGKSDDEAVAIVFSQGKGEVIWWASATPLTNSAVKEPGNLEFFLACVDGGNRRVIFDEYFHGHRPGQALSDTGRALWWLMAQVGLLTFVVVLTYSRRSGPVQMPRIEPRTSPLEFVETLGGLYERAKATKVPVDVAHQRFRYRITRKLALPINAPAEVIASSAADVLNYRNPALLDVLRRCEVPDGHVPEATESLDVVRTLSQLEYELRLSPREAEAPSAKKG